MLHPSDGWVMNDHHHVLGIITVIDNQPWLNNNPTTTNHHPVIYVNNPTMFISIVIAVTAEN